MAKRHQELRNAGKQERPAKHSLGLRVREISLARKAWTDKTIN
jgi:hypothetical protein